MPLSVRGFVFARRTLITSFCACTVDFFHFKNHCGAYCHKFTNPNRFPLLAGVNSEICEQMFTWLNRYKLMFRGMNEVRFNFMLLKLSQLKADEHDRVRTAKTAVAAARAAAAAACATGGARAS